MKMASSCLTILTYFLVTVLSAYAKEYVPVLLWESPNPGGQEASAAALSKMNMEEFSDVLVRRVDRSPVVVLFSAETLSVEDFSRQDTGLRSSFPALQSITDVTGLQFIPAVQTPLKALNRLSKLGYKWQQVTDEELPEGGKKVLVVNLNDVKMGEDRSEMLLRHDKRVASLYKLMEKKYPDVLAIFTGQHSSWTDPDPSSLRFRRDAEPTAAPASCGTVLKTTTSNDNILLYSVTCPVLTMSNTTHNLTGGLAQSPDSRKGFQRMSVVYKLSDSLDKATLRYKFNFTDDGYWRLTQVEVELASGQKVVLDAKSDISAPNNFSYSCGSETLFRSDDGSTTLRFSNLQVQPGAQGGSFGPPYDCITFFTAPIWAGLFITFLLLFIVGWGIDMMMNIHTMDRFDDPKGKPLVFSAQE